MEKWEEIIKQNLKDSKVSLPEDDFALFQEKLANSKGASKAKIAVIVPFAKIAVPALAACAAVALVILHPFGVKDKLQGDKDLIQTAQPESVLADVPETEMISGEVNLEDVIDPDDEVVKTASDKSPAKVRRNTQRIADVRPLDQSDAKNDEVPKTGEEDKTEKISSRNQGSSEYEEDNESNPSNVDETPSKEQTVNEIIKGNSPGSSNNGLGGNDPLVRNRKSAGAGWKIAGVSGGALTGVLASAITAAGGILPRNADAYVPAFDSPMYSYVNPGYLSSLDDIAGVYRHVIPMKVGITARLQVLENLYVMSGLEYSMYYSKIEYTGLSSCNQFAHYVGVPVRMDWAFARAKKFDFYLGAGGEIDFCVAATQDGGKIDKDKPIFSATGAVGVQYNFSKLMGLYFEPQVFWSPSDDNNLSTFRSEHPVLLTGAIGLRFNL